MSKRKLDCIYLDRMDEGKRLILAFTRPLTSLEAQGILLAVREACARSNRP